MGLRWRIVLPFVLLFAALFAAVTWVAASQVVGAVEDRLTAQAENLARLLAQSPGMLASPQLPKYIGGAFDAGVAVEVGGEFRHGSLGPGLLAALGKESAAGRLPGKTGLLQEVRPEGGDLFLAAYAPISADSNLYLLYRPEIVEARKARALVPVLVVAGIGLLLVGILAYVTARTIARPVERLASAARRISGGKLEIEVPPVRGGSEIDRLVEAFRNMVEGLRRYQEDLVSSERLAVLGQMAAGIAHEIRNPLSAMKMTVQMLREDSAPEKREPCDVLLREIERLELAVAEIFSAAHPSRLQKGKVGLADMADEVLSLLNPQLEHLSVSVEKRFEKSPEIEVDRNVFKRAVMNLVLNGAQAMPEGGTLEVGVSAENGVPRFAVTDRGPGIPEEVRGRIFEPFVTSKPGGMGLGLAVTKRIVEDHGGRIGFETSGSGSTFWIEIPGVPGAD